MIRIFKDYRAAWSPTVPLSETGPESWRALWLRGGFPRAYLARNDRASAVWRPSFVQTFLERDIPQLRTAVPADTLQRFWTTLAHYHGQVWNAVEFTRALGSNEGTARRYLDTLTGAFMVRAFPLWFADVRKRQVKEPRIYVCDTGPLHPRTRRRPMCGVPRGPPDRRPATGLRNWDQLHLDGRLR